jgi:hypothetical protein
VFDLCHVLEIMDGHAMADVRTSLKKGEFRKMEGCEITAAHVEDARLQTITLV